MKRFLTDRQLLELARLCVEEELVDEDQAYEHFMKELAVLLMTHLGGQVLEVRRPPDHKSYGVMIETKNKLPI